MKTINFRNQPDFEVLAAADINFTCNSNMDLVISDEDYERLEKEFPAAFDDCYIVEDETERTFNLMAGEENSIFVWSSPFAKNFSEMPEVTDDMIVVITNAQHTYVTIYDVKGFSEHDIMRVVERHCSYVSRGCNYTYKFIKKVGNCYFVN